MKVPRRPDPRIVNPATHPKRWVNLSVAAEFLDMPDRRTLLRYVEEGSLHVELKGRWRKAHIDELVRFKAWLRARARAS